MLERQIAPIGVDIVTPDLRGFGCRAGRAESFDELARMLTAATTGTVPTLIELRADAPFLVP